MKVSRKSNVSLMLAKKRSKAPEIDASDLAEPMANPESEHRAPISSSHEEGDQAEYGIYPQHDDEQGLSDNVMDAEALAEGLQAERMKANDNHVSYEADDKVAGQKMSRGGQMQEDYADTDVGNKPDLDFIDDGTGEPMNSMPKKPVNEVHPNHEPSGMGLSEEAKEAVARKKAMRRYGQYNPR